MPITETPFSPLHHATTPYFYFIKIMGLKMDAVNLTPPATF
jgi:hypothetical protein